MASFRVNLDQWMIRCAEESFGGAVVEAPGGFVLADAFEFGSVNRSAREPSITSILADSSSNSVLSCHGFGGESFCTDVVDHGVWKGFTS
jgi:hypothetical protein